jgi:hypothetical protein
MFFGKRAHHELGPGVYALILAFFSLIGMYVRNRIFAKKKR